jgi:hypothetical protein
LIFFRTRTDDGPAGELQTAETVHVGEQVVLPLAAFPQGGLSFFQFHEGIVTRRRKFVKKKTLPRDGSI